ncbi:polygalacturonase [Iris pallida]|uniref:Polygalacturonase n=1 Tax=Iris pallida TaxID=29817 RepID=A0AAX6DWK6_IRIPA|nr:polygalacturonase [Iris pallida]
MVGTCCGGSPRFRRVGEGSARGTDLETGRLRSPAARGGPGSTGSRERPGSGSVPAAPEFPSTAALGAVVHWWMAEANETSALTEGTSRRHGDDRR